MGGTRCVGRPRPAKPASIALALVVAATPAAAIDPAPPAAKPALPPPAAPKPALEPAAPRPTAEPAALAVDGRTVLVPFETAPFPYRGTPPGQGKPFLDVDRGGRKGHTARGGVLFEDKTYSDRRVLIAVPRGFDPSRPVLLVVYLHGGETVLERDLRDRLRLPKQVVESGLNAVLVAPQFAVDAADASAGAFWTPGHFARFLDEAGEQVAKAIDDPKAAPALGRAQVLVVAHGGGGVAAAFAVTAGGAEARLAGIVLLDGLYAEEARFAEWLKKKPRSFFFSAYTTASDEANARLVKLLAEAGTIAGNGLPARFNPGDISFFYAGRDANTRDFPAKAWVSDPLKSVLGRIAGYPRPAVSAAAVPAAAAQTPTAANAAAPAPRAPQWVPTMNHDQLRDFVGRFGAPGAGSGQPGR